AVAHLVANGAADQPAGVKVRLTRSAADEIVAAGVVLSEQAAAALHVERESSTAVDADIPATDRSRSDSHFSRRGGVQVSSRGSPDAHDHCSAGNASKKHITHIKIPLSPEGLMRTYTRGLGLSA